MSSETLDKLIKKYVDHQERYNEANKVVLKHKKLQEKIKEGYEKQGISAHTIRQDGYHATLEFNPITYYKIDTSILPESIKEQYKKKVVMRKERLKIYQSPNA